MLKLSEPLKQNGELPVSYSRGRFYSLAGREVETNAAKEAHLK